MIGCLQISTILNWQSENFAFEVEIHHRSFSMFLKTVLLFFPLFFLFSNYCNGQPPNVEKIRESLRKEFGKEVNNTTVLYEINQDFVLQIIALDDDVFVGFKVFPKYYLETCFPQLEIPNSPVRLSSKLYNNLLDKINTIYEIGKLTEEDKIGVKVVTNSRMSLVDKYEKSYVKRFVFSDYFKTDEKSILSFEIFVSRNLEGIVEQKASSGISKSKITQIKVNGNWYLGDKVKVKKAVIGKHLSFPVAGPLNIEKKICD
jgi:hypothetical protein